MVTEAAAVAAAVAVFPSRRSPRTVLLLYDTILCVSYIYIISIKIWARFTHGIYEYTDDFSCGGNRTSSPPNPTGGTRLFERPNRCGGANRGAREGL